MRIAIDPGAANDPEAHRWLDRILYRVADGWHVWDLSEASGSDALRATTWIGGRAFLLYLASLRPRSLHGDADLDPGALLSRLGTDAVGYVWSNPDPKGLVSSPANRMFVDDDHVGQAIGPLAALDDDMLRTVLSAHGFPADSVGRLRNDDRAGLLAARLETLIAGERQFMAERKVTLPTEQTAATIADSETSDDE